MKQSQTGAGHRWTGRRMAEREQRERRGSRRGAELELGNRGTAQRRRRTGPESLGDLRGQQERVENMLRTDERERRSWRTGNSRGTGRRGEGELRTAGELGAAEAAEAAGGSALERRRRRSLGRRMSRHASIGNM